MDEIKLAIFPKEGEPVYYYMDENDTYHAHYLGEYLDQNYPNADVDKRNANSISLFLRENGETIFLNTTSYKENIFKKHGRTGILIVPDVISEKQEQHLLELNNRIQNYDVLQIWHEFSSRNECKMTSRTTNAESKELLPGFLEYYKEKQYVGKTK